MTDRADLLVADLARIPAVLAAHAAAPAPEPPLGAPRRIVLTGLGSSRFAAHALVPALRATGADVVVEHASTSRPVTVGPGSLVVAISSSGSTAETVSAAERAGAAGARVLAVTNRPGSPLAAATREVLLLDAAEEASGVASLTYAATVAALVRLTATSATGPGIDAARALGEAAGVARSLLEGREAWLGAAADLLDSGAPIHVIADAAALGTAEQAALLFREGPRLLSDATDAGDWFHVGIYTALPGYRALLLAGTPYDGELVEVIHERGGRVVAIGPSEAAAGAAADLAIAMPDLVGAGRAALARALVEPIVTSLLAAELWRRTGAVDR